MSRATERLDFQSHFTLISFSLNTHLQWDSTKLEEKQQNQQNSTHFSLMSSLSLESHNPHVGQDERGYHLHLSRHKKDKVTHLELLGRLWETHDSNSQFLTTISAPYPRYLHNNGDNNALTA